MRCIPWGLAVSTCLSLGQGHQETSEKLREREILTQWSQLDVICANVTRYASLGKSDGSLQRDFGPLALACVHNLVKSDPQWALQPLHALQREFGQRRLLLHLYAVPIAAQNAKPPHLPITARMPHSDLARRFALRVHIGTRDDWMQFRSEHLQGVGDAELTARLGDAGFESIV